MIPPDTCIAANSVRLENVPPPDTMLLTVISGVSVNPCALVAVVAVAALP